MTKKHYIDQPEFVAGRQLPRLGVMIIILICATITSFIVWASVFELNIYAKAIGVVKYRSGIHKVETIVGGVVKKVWVKNNQLVTEGQSIVEVKNPEDANKLYADEYQIADYKVNLARLSAVINGTPFTIPSDLSKKFPQIAQTQQEQYQIDVQTLKQSRDQIKRNKKLLEQELNMVRPLVQRRVLASIEQLRLENKLSDLDTKSFDLINKFKKSAALEQAKLSTKLQTLQHISQTIQSNVGYSEVRAPISGIIHNLKIERVGDVLDPGEEIATVLPNLKELKISAELPPEKVGFVRVGMPVSVHVDAYTYSVYGDLVGRVSSISKDSIKRSNGTRFFKVTIRTSANSIVYKGEQLDIKPGMTVVANIKVSRMRLITYLFKPIIKTFVQGFV